MPLRHRPDFKQALSTLQRLQQEAEEEPQVPTYSYKHQQWEAQSSSSTCRIGKVHGGLLVIPKVKKETHEVLSERSDLLLAVFGKFLRTRLSLIQFILLQLDLLQLTAVCCNRRLV